MCVCVRVVYSLFLSLDSGLFKGVCLFVGGGKRSNVNKLKSTPKVI